jgi:hypothetical protein
LPLGFDQRLTPRISKTDLRLQQILLLSPVPAAEITARALS